MALASPISVDFDQHKIEVRASDKKSRRRSLRFNALKLPQKVRAKDIRDKFNTLWKILLKRGWQANNTRDGWFYCKPHVKNRQTGVMGLDMWDSADKLLEYLTREMHASYFEVFEEFFRKHPDKLANVLSDSEGDSTPTRDLIDSALEAEVRTERLAVIRRSRSQSLDAATSKTTTKAGGKNPRARASQHTSKRRRRSSGGNWAPAGRNADGEDDDVDADAAGRYGTDVSRRRRSLQGKPSPGTEEEEIGTWGWPRLQSDGWTHANGDKFNAFCYLMPGIANKSKGKLGESMFMGERELGRYIMGHRPDIVDAWRTEKEDVDVARHASEVAAARISKKKKARRHKQRKEAELRRARVEQDLDSFHFTRDVTFQMLWPNVLAKEMGWKYFPYSGLEAAWAYALPTVKRSSNGIVGKNMWIDEDEIVEIVKQDPELARRAESIIRRQMRVQAGLLDNVQAQGELEMDDGGNADLEEEEVVEEEGAEEGILSNRRGGSSSSSKPGKGTALQRTHSVSSSVRDEKRLSLGKAQKRFPLTAKSSFQELWRVLHFEMGWGFLPYSGIEGDWLYHMPGITRRTDGVIGVNMWCDEAMMHKAVLRTPSVAKQVEEFFEEEARSAELEEEHRRDQEAARAKAMERREAERKEQARLRAAERLRQAEVAAEERRRRAQEAAERRQRKAERRQKEAQRRAELKQKRTELRDELNAKLQGRLIDGAGFNDIWNFLRYDCQWKYFPWSGLEGSFAYALPDVARASEGNIGVNMWLKENDVVDFVRSHPTWLDRCEMHLREVVCEEYAAKLGVDNIQDFLGGNEDVLGGGSRDPRAENDSDRSSGSAPQAEDNEMSDDDDDDDDENDDVENDENEDIDNGDGDLLNDDGDEDEDAVEEEDDDDGDDDDNENLSPSERARRTVDEATSVDEIFRALEALGWSRHTNYDGRGSKRYYLPDVSRRNGVLGKTMWSRGEDVLAFVRSHPTWRKRLENQLAEAGLGETDLDAYGDESSRNDAALRMRAENVFKSAKFARIWDILKTLGWRWFPSTKLQSTFVYAMPHVKRKSDGIIGKDLFETEDDLVHFVEEDADVQKMCINVLYDVLLEKQKIDEEKDRGLEDDEDDDDEEEEEEDEDDDDDDEESVADNEMNSALHGHVIEKADFAELWEILQDRFKWRRVEDPDSETQTYYVKPADEYGEADERFEFNCDVTAGVISNPLLRRDVAQQLLQRWRDRDDPHLAEVSGWEEVLANATGQPERAVARGQSSQSRRRASTRSAAPRLTGRKRAWEAPTRKTRRQSGGSRRVSSSGRGANFSNAIDLVDEDDEDDEDVAEEGDQDENDILASATFNDVWTILRRELSWQYFPNRGLESAWRYALPEVKRSSEGTLGVNMWTREEDVLEYVRKSSLYADEVRRRLEEASASSASDDSSAEDEDAENRDDSAEDDLVDNDDDEEEEDEDEGEDHDILEDATFNEVWAILRGLSWQYFPYRGLESAWRYALPEIKKSTDGTLGVNMWVREEDVLDYVKRTPRYADEVRRQLQEAAMSEESQSQGQDTASSGSIASAREINDHGGSEKSESGSDADDDADSYAKMSRRELWLRLRSEGWHHARGRGLVSHYYLAPQVSALEDGIMGETVFDSEEALYTYFQTRAKTQKMAKTASPVSQSVLATWNIMREHGWRQVGQLFVSPDAAPVRTNDRAAAVFEADHCTVFRSMSRAVSNYITTRSMSPVASGARGRKRRRSEALREGTKLDRAAARGHDDDGGDEEIDEIDDDEEEELPEEITVENFWDDVWPCLAKKGWTRTRKRSKTNKGAARNGFRAPSGFSGPTTFPRVSDLCAFLREQQRAQVLAAEEEGDALGEDEDESSDEEDAAIEAQRTLNEYVQTLREEQPRPENFFKVFWPILVEAGWSYRFGSGIATEIYLGPGVKRISDGIKGETMIESRESMCEWIKLNRAAIQESLRRALLMPEEKETPSPLSSPRDVELAQQGDEDEENCPVVMDTASSAGSEEELADAARERGIESPDAAATRPQVRQGRKSTDTTRAYAHPSGVNLRAEYQQAVEATSQLKQAWPGREEQIDVLTGLMGPRHLLTSHLLLHGDTATGKSGVVRMLFKTLGYPYAAVDCEECYTLPLLFQRLLSQMPEPLESDSGPGEAGAAPMLGGDLDKDNENAAATAAADGSEDPLDMEMDSYVARKNRNVAENRAVLESLGIVLSPEAAERRGGAEVEDDENDSQAAAARDALGLGDATISQAAPDGRKRGQQGAERCATMREFVFEISRRLRPAREAAETFYLLLENAARLEDLGPKLLPALLQLERSTGCNVCVVMTSSELPSSMSLVLRNAPACFVEFPAYSQMEQRKILSMQLGARAGDRFTESDVRNFVSGVLQTFSSQVRDLREISRICFDLWESLVQRPGFSGKPHAAFRVALEGRIGLTFKMLYHHDFELDPRAENPSVTALERWERDEIKRAADLPYDSKIVLLAAFLGSYNSPDHDRTLFGHARKLSKQQKYGSAAATARKLANAGAGQLLLGPKVFALERLVNLYRALEGMLESMAARPGESAQGGSAKRPTRQLNKQVASLISAGLLARVSRPDDLDVVKLKCTVPYDFAQALAETVKLNLGDLLEA